VELVYAQGGTQRVAERRVSAERRLQLVLSEGEVLELARWAVRVEQHYSQRAGHPVPMDLEWGKDGRSGAQ